MGKIRRNALLCSKENYDMLLNLYAGWVIQVGREHARDNLFEHMLTSENLINLMFMISIDRIEELIEKSPVKDVKNFQNMFKGW